MMTPYDIGLEQVSGMQKDIFNLSKIEIGNILGEFSSVDYKDLDLESKHLSEGEDTNKSLASDDELDVIENELDHLYEQYLNRRKEHSAKLRIKNAKLSNFNDEYEYMDFNDSDNESNTCEDYSIDDVEIASSVKRDHSKLSTVLLNKSKTINGLSRSESMFFDKEEFKEINSLSLSYSESRNSELRQKNSLNNQNESISNIKEEETNSGQSMIKGKQIMILQKKL